jgi:thiol-disulfide isomerase/thioredoxin
MSANSNPGTNTTNNTNVEKKEYVLFYSPNCKFCKNFLTKLKSKAELLKKINLVDIDNLDDIPEEVDEIPCIYDGKKVFKGPEAFKWFDDKSVEFLDAADDCVSYSFINGNDEKIFNNYSLLDQQNGSFGMGETTINENKITKSANMSLESLMSSRSSDMQNFK